MIRSVRKKTRVLFLSHDATRTGAPIQLLRTLRTLKKRHDDIVIEIALAESGVLEDDFRAVAPTTTLFHRRRRGVMGFFGREGLLRARSMERLTKLKSRVTRGELDLICANTITLGDLTSKLAGHSPIITWVHELEQCVRELVLSAELDLVRLHTTRFIACAEVVRRNLIDTHGILSDKITVIHESGPESVPNEEIRRSARLELFRELRLEPDTILVGGAGTVEWRKAPELMLLVAAALLRKRPQAKVHFAWMGGGGGEVVALSRLEHDARAMGIANRIHLLGARTNALEVISAFDLFLLPSREDPFPLVALEAARLGKPLIAFEGSGGAAELIAHGCGVLVPYGDIEQMAQATLDLVDDRGRHDKLGARGEQIVRTKFGIEVTTDALAETIRGMVG